MFESLIKLLRVVFPERKWVHVHTVNVISPGAERPHRSYWVMQDELSGKTKRVRIL